MLVLVLALVDAAVLMTFAVKQEAAQPQQSPRLHTSRCCRHTLHRSHLYCHTCEPSGSGVQHTKLFVDPLPTDCKQCTADPDQTEPRPLFNQPPTTAQHHATTPWMWTQTTWRRKIRTRNPTSSEVYSLQTQNIIVCIILYPDESILVGGSKDHEDDFFLTGPKINMSGLRQQFEQEST